MQSSVPTTTPTILLLSASLSLQQHMPAGGGVGVGNSSQSYHWPPLPLPSPLTRIDLQVIYYFSDCSTQDSFAVVLRTGMHPASIPASYWPSTPASSITASRLVDSINLETSERL